MIYRLLTIALLGLGSCTLAYAQAASTPSDAKDTASTTSTTPKAAHHHARKAVHRSHDTAMRDQDRAYRGALKRCVEGPQDQRDRCLDQAIAQYGH